MTCNNDREVTSPSQGHFPYFLNVIYTYVTSIVRLENLIDTLVMVGEAMV